MKAGRTILIAVVAVFALAACGEKPAVTVYKQGQYKGKTDALPWANEQFKNDKTAWENAVKARNLNQNEYLRTTGKQ